MLVSLFYVLKYARSPRLTFVVYKCYEHACQVMLVPWDECPGGLCSRTLCTDTAASLCAGDLGYYKPV